MIAYTGFPAYAHGVTTPLVESTFTQRFRTDEVHAIWREKEMPVLNNIHSDAMAEVSKDEASMPTPIVVDSWGTIGLYNYVLLLMFFHDS